MPQDSSEINQEEKTQLPIDPWTIILGLAKRWRIFAAFAVVFCVLAYFAGKSLGTKEYKTQTVMLYKPPSEGEAESEGTPSLFTQLSLVKIEPNIHEVRERLVLKTTLKQISAAITVSIQSKTSLMVIQVKWPTAKNAAAIANTLREVYIEKQIKIRKAKARQEAKDLTIRVNTVNEQLKTAENALEEFTVKHRVVDLSQEAQWLLEQMTTLDLSYEDAMMEKQTIDLQAKNLDKIIENLKVRVSKEKSKTSAEMEAMSTLKARAERLNEKITADRDFRANSAVLAEKEVDMERKKTLVEKGYISKSEYDEAVAAYKEQKAMTIDSEEVKKWRAELDKVDKALLPSENGDDSTVGRLMYDLMLRSFNIQLQKVALTEKVLSYETAIKKVNDKLARLPQLQRQHTALSREVTLRESEKKGLERMLGKVNRLSNSDASAFSTVSPARVPLFPSKSNKKMIMIAIAFMGFAFGFFVIVVLELLDTTIKSRGELECKLKAPVLGALPKLESGFLAYPGKMKEDHSSIIGEDSNLLELFREIVRHIRIALPKKGIRLLVTSLTSEEGKTLVAANLAACFGRQDERVLLIDGQVRKEKHCKSNENKDKLLLSDWAIKDTYPLLGLGDYLSYIANDMNEFKLPTVIPGVECLPCFDEAVIPDLLESTRMGELLKDASKRFGIIIVDSQAMSNGGDALALARWMDGVIFIIESQKCSAGKIKAAIAKLKSYKVPVVGLILNKIQKPYL